MWQSLLVEHFGSVGFWHTQPSMPLGACSQYLGLLWEHGVLCLQSLFRVQTRGSICLSPAKISGFLQCYLYLFQEDKKETCGFSTHVSRIFVAPLVALWPVSQKPRHPETEMEQQRTCAICLEPCHNESEAKLDCGHAFHGQCIVDAMRAMRAGTGDPCPLCRGVDQGAAADATARRVASASRALSAMRRRELTSRPDVAQAMQRAEELRSVHRAAVRAYRAAEKEYLADVAAIRAHASAAMKEAIAAATKRVERECSDQLAAVRRREAWGRMQAEAKEAASVMRSIRREARKAGLRVETRAPKRRRYRSMWWCSADRETQTRKSFMGTRPKFSVGARMDMLRIEHDERVTVPNPVQVSS